MKTRRFFALLLVLPLLATLPLACKDSETPTNPGPSGPVPTATPTDPAPCPSPASFGSTTTGANLGSNAGNLVATRWQLPEDARIVKFGIYMTGAGPMRLALYADDPGAQAPTTLLRQSVQVALALGWNEVEIPDVSVPAGYYWLARQIPVTAAGTYYPITDWNARSAAMIDFPYGSFPASFPVSILENSGAVIPFVAYYCTHTPTFTPTDTPSPTLTPTATDTPTPP